jgi:CHAD domain-containing protein
MADNVPAPMGKALARRVGKGLRKFSSLLSTLASGDDPKAVHQARVRSRRLQQHLGVLFPKPYPRKIRKLRRKLRRIRRALGEWRNCDVMLALVAREQRRTRGQTTRRAWQAVREYIHGLREREIVRARHKLRKNAPKQFSMPALKSRQRTAGGQDTEASMQPLRISLEKGWSEWRAAFEKAEESRDANSIHAFRIATKRLRYRVELLCDLGDAASKPCLVNLKKWQSQLGVWQDRQALRQWMAETLARPEFLLHEPQTARTLLSLLEKCGSRQSAEQEGIFPRIRETIQAEAKPPDGMERPSAV